MTSHDKIHSSSINKNISKDDKMAPINRTVKINLDGTSRAVDVPAPPSLAALQTAVCSAFHSEISSSSSVARGGEIKLSFAWTDANGDDVVFDKDSELNLALRLCGDSLEISATRKAELVKVSCSLATTAVFVRDSPLFSICAAQKVGKHAVNVKGDSLRKLYRRTVSSQKRPMNTVIGELSHCTWNIGGEDARPVVVFRLNRLTHFLELCFRSAPAPDGI